MTEQLHNYDPADALDSPEAVEVFMTDTFETLSNYPIPRPLLIK